MADESADLSLVDEEARRRFESSWREGSPLPIDEFLPGADTPAYLPTLEELICIELEFAWMKYEEADDGEIESTPPQTESYLNRFPALNEPKVIRRLVKEEYRVRHRYGDRPSSHEFCERFPEVVEDAALLETVAEDVRLVDRSRLPEPGDRIGPYRLSNEHGRGGIGTVWRAKDTRLRREVALKQLRRGVAGDAHIRLRFVTEARITSQLDHPGIVPVYDMRRLESGEPYYTMKLVRGETLTEAIRRYHDPELTTSKRNAERRRLVSAFLDVTRTMAFAHDRGVIHRDLKPDNIILGEFGETLILDWGLAKVLTGEKMDDASKAEFEAAEASRNEIFVTQLGTVLGTPAYMSPEQAAGRIEEVDYRSDIYALGTILYEIITGRRWVFGDSTLDVIEQVRNATPVRPHVVNPNVSRRLEAICMVAMARKPADRYQTVDGLRRDLEAYLAFEPISVYREPLTAKAGRWMWRHRNLVAISTATVVLLFVAAIAYSFVQQAELRHEITQQKLEKQQQDQNLQAIRFAEVDLKTAKEQVRLGDYADALHQLDLASGRLEGISGAGELREKVKSMHDRVSRLNDFDQHAAAALTANYHDRHEEAIASFSRAFDRLDILDKDEWWRRLPDNDLTQSQQEDLRDEVLGLMVFYAGELAVSELTKFPFCNKKVLGQALDVCERAQEYQATNAGELVRLFCELGSGAINKEQLQERLADFPAPTPTCPVDYRVMGIGHLFVAGSIDDYLTKFLLSFAKPDAVGVDDKTPLATSEKYLRESIRLRPNAFWSHVWLGHALRARNRPFEAESVYTTCIVLRPDISEGYIDRALALVQQRALPENQSPEKREHLERRIREDMQTALDREPHVPWVRVIRARCFGWLDDRREAFREVVRFYEVEMPYRQLKGTYMEAYMDKFRAEVSQGANALINDMPDEPAGYLVLAIAHSQTEKHDEVERLAREALDRAVADHDKARSHALIGLSQLQRAKKTDDDEQRARLEQALKTYEQAVNAWPKHYPATIGRVETLLLLDRPKEAIEKLDYMNRGEIAITNWQRTDMKAFRSRALVDLERYDEARQLVSEIRETRPLTADRLREELFSRKD